MEAVREEAGHLAWWLYIDKQAVHCHRESRSVMQALPVHHLGDFHVERSIYINTPLLRHLITNDVAPV
jgi:hypothetical protein